VKRFLRFASLHHVHGACALWAATLWFSGVWPALALAPVAYFTGLVALGRCFLPLAGLEHLSLFILALNGLNALHLAALCVMQGSRVLASPAFAFVPLSRVLFGLFTQEAHCHLALSTVVAALAVGCNGELVIGCETLLVIVVALLFELTAVVVLAEGPCGYEEALMHLARCRAQHQLMRSQAAQRMDVEREEFSGQLLAVATQGIAELTAAVQRASEPALSMLKAACATGTKSGQEAERIGRIGEALKEEVAEILRYKTQVAWTRLQERAKERTHQLQEYALAQQTASEAMLQSIQQSVGGSLAQMHELELEAESSLEQMVQGEISRVMETADARMDLVRQSAQAMERRVSDTVEVLLSLLKYFRCRGGHHVVAAPRPHCSSRGAGRAASHDAITRQGHRTEAPHRTLPAIHERAPAEVEGESHADVTERAAMEEASHLEQVPAAALPPSMDVPGSRLSLDSSAQAPCALAPLASLEGPHDTTPSSPSGPAGSAGSSVASEESENGRAATGSTCCGPTAEAGSSAASDGGLGGESAAGSRTSESATEDLPSESDQSGAGHWMPPLPGAKRAVAGQGSKGISASMAALERHPLFATRLCYQTDNFFWCWAASRDFRGEADALRQWQRANAEHVSAERTPVEQPPSNATGSAPPSSGGSSCSAGVGVCGPAG